MYIYNILLLVLYYVVVAEMLCSISTVQVELCVANTAQQNTKQKNGIYSTIYMLPHTTNKSNKQNLHRMGFRPLAFAVEYQTPRASIDDDYTPWP